MKKKITLEILAQMIADGFAETATKKDLAEVRVELKEDISKLDGRIDVLEDGQKKIILHLKQVPYDFEVKALEQRVKVVEKQSGIKPKLSYGTI